MCRFVLRFRCAVLVPHSIPFFLVCVLFLRFIMSTIVEMKDFSARPRSTSWVHRHGHLHKAPATAADSPIDVSPEPSAIHFHNEHTEEQGLLGSSSTGSGSADGEDSDEIVCRVKKYQWTPPAGSETRVYEKHQVR